MARDDTDLIEKSYGMDLLPGKPNMPSELPKFHDEPRDEVISDDGRENC